ncbi:MAG: hypothetical protein HY297_04155 [Thaumarchaeota archaeon]|nr:hypothetical protein [Nitrososphaerota archaeon]
MLDFFSSFLSLLVSTAIPAFVGLLAITNLGSRIKSRYMTSFALGIFFWFFVDTIEGSGDLDVNAGFEGGLGQLVVIALFAAGLILFLWADRNVFVGGEQTPTLAIPILVAVAVGIHGFGEGSAFGNTIATTTNSSLLGAFGGVSAGIAYALHKALEPMMIGAIYVCAQGAKSASRRMTDILVLTLVFTLPSLVGAATGYYLEYDSNYSFALGTGASIYVALRLAKQLFAGGEASSQSESLKAALWLLFGFICIYIAALFHS